MTVDFSNLSSLIWLSNYWVISWFRCFLEYHWGLTIDSAYVDSVNAGWSAQNMDRNRKERLVERLEHLVVSTFREHNLGILAWDTWLSNCVKGEDNCLLNTESMLGNLFGKKVTSRFSAEIFGVDIDSLRIVSVNNMNGKTVNRQKGFVYPEWVVVW